MSDENSNAGSNTGFENANTEELAGAMAQMGVNNSEVPPEEQGAAEGDVEGAAEGAAGEDNLLQFPEEEAAAPPARPVAPAPTAAANKTGKPLTAKQAELQEKRLETLKIMRDRYKEVFGDDAKAPKAKAYHAAGLTTIREKEGEEAFNTALQKHIDENQKKYSNKGVATTVKSKAAKKVSMAAPSNAAAAGTSVARKTVKKAATSGMNANALRAQAAALLKQAEEAEKARAFNAERAAIEAERTAARAAKEAEAKAARNLQERAAANLKAALGADAPPGVVSGFVKLLKTGRTNVNAKLFSDICSFCTRKRKYGSASKKTAKAGSASAKSKSASASSTSAKSKSGSKRA